MRDHKRAALQTLGATNDDIEPAISDIDGFDDAPIG
jgi:hypothetical protein